MPKMKTHKGAAKRFKLTKSGKLKKNKSGLNHLLTCKSRKRKRHLRKDEVLHKTDEARVKRMLGL